MTEPQFRVTRRWPDGRKVFEFVGDEDVVFRVAESERKMYPADTVRVYKDRKIMWNK